MAKTLHARPNLDHLKKQAKTLLAEWRAGDAAAVQAFADHLPAARGLTPAKIRAAAFRLADAQSVIARAAGFAGWKYLAAHVEQLRALEGEWAFASLEIDGLSLPPAASAQSRILIDGDRFRTESPEANYEGVFTIDVEANPHRIDIAFVEGPEAGQTAEGIFALDGDQLTICLGLVGSSRPAAFVTTRGCGHALERLRRASASRPKNVTGGTPTVAKPTSAAVAAAHIVDPTSFDAPVTPLIERMQGHWVPTALVRDGVPMNDQWLAYGSRVGTGNDVKVVFGGQTMVHAKVRVNDQVTPIAIDYLGLSGAAKNKISLGILEWIDDELLVVMSQPGDERPTEFTAEKGSGRTLSRWKRDGVTE